MQHPSPLLGLKVELVGAEPLELALEREQELPFQNAPQPSLSSRALVGDHCQGPSTVSSMSRVARRSSPDSRVD